MSEPSPPSIIIAGSLNIDLVVRVSRFPEVGETITGEDLKTIPGGKGANQAAAAARLGAPTALVGRVGKDAYGETLIDQMESFTVDTGQVTIDETCSTGTAVILVNEQGANKIVLSPGANSRVTAEDIDRVEPLFASAQLLLLQLEIPLDTVSYAADQAARAGLRVILNPAPAAELPVSLLEKTDILVPNETELELLSDRAVSDLESAAQAARSLLEHGLETVIVTLGDQGSLIVTRKNQQHLPAPEVEAVDTTAAGDAFVGGLAAALTRGFSREEAVRYANCAGALAATKFGAQPSLPNPEEIAQLYP